MRLAPSPNFTGKIFIGSGAALGGGGACGTVMPQASRERQGADDGIGHPSQGIMNHPPGVTQSG